MKVEKGRHICGNVGGKRIAATPYADNASPGIRWNAIRIPVGSGVPIGIDSTTVKVGILGRYRRGQSEQEYQSGRDSRKGNFTRVHEYKQGGFFDVKSVFRTLRVNRRQGLKRKKCNKLHFSLSSPESLVIPWNFMHAQWVGGPESNPFSEFHPHPAPFRSRHPVGTDFSADSSHRSRSKQPDDRAGREKGHLSQLLSLPPDQTLLLGNVSNQFPVPPGCSSNGTLSCGKSLRVMRKTMPKSVSPSRWSRMVAPMPMDQLVRSL